MHNTLTKWKTKFIFMLGTIITLAGAFWLQTSNLMWGDWTYDQGFYFTVVRLMDKGFMPYHELHMSEQPLMAWSAYLPYWLFDSIWGMQFFMVGYAILGIAALIRIGQSLDGKLTGLLAGLLLVAHFEFFRSARLVNPETTSVSLALVAVALALRYRVLGRRHWLLLSAMAMAGSFLLKLFMVTAVPLIAAILLFYPTQNTKVSLGTRLKQEKARILQDYLLWFGLILAVVAASWAAAGLSGLWEQSILFYMRRNAAHPYDIALNLKTIWKIISGWPVLSLLGVWGLGRTLFQFKRFGWIIFSWTLLTLVFLMSFTPLRDKHLAMLLPLLALLAALALSQLAGFWRLSSKSQLTIKWGAGLVLVILAVLLAVEMVTPFKKLAKAKKPLVEGDTAIITEGLLKLTSPNDCIITDDPYVAFVSGRLPPPWLSNMSYARFESGSLDMQGLIDVTNRHNCQAVVPTFGRIKNGIRPYYDWTKGNYLRIWVVEGKEIMLGKPLTQANPAMPAYANFDNQAELLGIDWVEGDSRADKQAYVSLYWKTLKPFTQNYKIFVHLRDATGQTVVSADHEVFDGLLPTQLWPVKLIIKDTIRLSIPADITPGQYNIYAGLYDPTTLERLPVAADTSGENAAIIPGIVIQ